MNVYTRFVTQIKTDFPDIISQLIIINCPTYLFAQINSILGDLNHLADIMDSEGNLHNKAEQHLLIKSIESKVVKDEEIIIFKTNSSDPRLFSILAQNKSENIQ